MSKIDWYDAEKQIRKSYTLSDKEVDGCLHALDHAKEVYIDNIEQPERINLTDAEGNVCYTIITKNGTPMTVIYGPKNSNKYNIAFITASLCLIGAICGIYWMKYK